MKFIPGFEFVAGTAAPQKRGGSMYEQNNSRRSGGVFKTGEMYKLHHIRKTKEDKMQYSFHTREGIQELTFESIGDAEEQIAKSAGVDLNI